MNRIATSVAGPAPRPCESCPYRRDAPSGVWSAAEYAKLPGFDEDTALQPQALFMCHQNPLDHSQSRLCAGWVACHGDELLSLRLAVADGRVDGAVLDYCTDVAVFGSGEEAARHGLRDIEHPGAAAVEVMKKIYRRRPDATM